MKNEAGTTAGFFRLHHREPMRGRCVNPMLFNKQETKGLQMR